MTNISERVANLSAAKLRLLDQRLGTRLEVAEPIAIVGMSCRFPGAPDLNGYWRLISEGVDATSEIPSSRWNVDHFFDPSGEQRGKMSVRRAGTVSDVDKFDAMFFGISPREAVKMDPQQRLLLEVGWEALESAGLAPERMCGTATGVFVGIGATDYSKIPTQYDDCYQYIDAYVGTGNALSIAANRLSYVLDLHGPSVAVDTACSSSSVAVHLAVQSLRNRECSAALAGGVNLILTPETTIAFSKAHMLSPDGRCRPFDASANGYVRGEGCALLVLKRLTDATRDGDPILALIRASAINQDGRTSGIAAPNGRSQQAVIRAALEQARWGTDRISYIEAHGTGTPLGDPIEMEALSHLFRRRQPDEAPCYITSVKANIGHTETVSGVAGIIKIVLMLQHGRIPPQLHFQQLNPHISLEGTRLQVPHEAIEWRSNGQPRVAGASSFGFGGTNSHVLLEEAPIGLVPAGKPFPERSDRPLHILAISAKSDTALAGLVERYDQYLTGEPDVSVADVCHTANAGRSHFHHRLAIIANGREELQGKLASLRQGDQPSGVRRGQVKVAAHLKVAFLFTGQGSQYVNMGRSLFETEPTFRRTLEQCDEILQDLLDQSLLSVLYPENDANSLLDETAFTQPALFALEYALASLWRSWGIEPAVVLGHSVGEYVAACVAGVFGLEDGLQLIAHRARLMQELPRDGMMAVAFANPTRVTTALEDWSHCVSIAAFNGPENTVISGDRQAVRAVSERLEADGIRTQPLTVSHAFHSPLMEPMLDAFEELAGRIDFQPPRIPLISNLTGAILEGGPPCADYWRKHVRHTVRFAEGIKQLAAQDVQAVVEIGPTASLLSMARRCVPAWKAAWLPSLRQRQGDWTVMLSSLAELYTLGAKIDWLGFDREWPRRRLLMPTYAFDRSRYWFSPMTPERNPAPAGRGPSLHPLLGSRVPVALESTLFESRVSSRSPQYLQDHQVQGSPVFPAAAYIEQGLAAAAQAFGPGRHTLEEVSIQQAMFLPPNVSRDVQVSLTAERGGEREWNTHSLAADTADAGSRWTLHACGRLRHGGADLDRDAILAICLDEIRAKAAQQTNAVHFYEMMQSRGLDYGPAFRVLDGLARTDAAALAEVHLPAAIQAEMKQYHLHPALGDALFQATAGLVPLEPDGTASPFTYMPTRVRQVRVYADLAEKMYVVAARTSTVDQPSPAMVEGDVSLVDEQGRVLVQFAGVRVQRVGRSQGQTESDPRSWLYRVNWHPLPSTSDDELTVPGVAPSRRSPDDEPDPMPVRDGTWFIFADHEGLGERLAHTLHDQGTRCVIVVPGEEFVSVAAENGFSPVYRIQPLCGPHYRRVFEEGLGHATEGCAGIIHLWSLRIPMPDQTPGQRLEDLRQLGCGSVLQLVQQLARIGWTKSPLLWLVTRGSQLVDDDQHTVAVAQSPLWGLGRVVALEHPELHCRLLDLDPSEPSVASVDCLCRELSIDSQESQIAHRQGRCYVARLESAADRVTWPGDDENTPAEDGAAAWRNRPFRLRLDKAGSFEGLKYESLRRRSPAEGQVEVAIRAAGVNFSDVLKVMGLYPGITDEIVPLGIEASGVITAVGDGVQRFKPGDEVLGVIPYSFASHALTAEYALVHKPSSLDHADAATIPIAFLTAYYALCRLANLERGERLLIHAGAGGVGLAAIQIAQHIGAEIFATAGSDEKREYLRQLGVRHVFSSRTLDFAEQILDVTHRQGVDVVLNSLPGDAIARSLSIMRAYGRFLEIGKIDIYQNRMIGLLPFQDNLSYFAIDLDRLLRQRPAMVQELFQEVMGHFAAGAYRPLPRQDFASDDVGGALRFMAQRKNIGKIVVSFADRSTEAAGPDPSGADPTVSAVQEDDLRDNLQAAEAGSDSESSSETGRIRPHGTYLITGGMGALGLQVAQWLAGQGARHLALLSRRPPSDEASRAIQALVATGVEVASLRGDVANRQSLEDALQHIPAGYPPLRGVVHAAGVLDDGVLFDMSLDRLDRALAPKVDGAWNLHTATQDAPLDFFVLFSSVASVLGSPGQGNYAAGNAFLDALASYRRSQGLPATGINWGPWAGAGMAGEAGRDGKMRLRGMMPIRTSHALELMGRLLDGDSTNTVVVDAQWPDLLRLLPSLRPSLLASMSQTSSEAAGASEADPRAVELRRTLSAAKPEEREPLLREHLAEELARITGIAPTDMDVDQPLNTLGVDSLMAMELKTVLESRLGFALPLARFFESPSITSLAAEVARMFAAESPSGAVGLEVVEGKLLPTAAGWSPMIPLDTSGSGPPLFCLHPAGGDVRCYFDLARRLASEQPVYTLTARGMVGSLEPHDSMTEMVTDYVNAIRLVQPEGPYHFAGWSTGGIIAHEVARNLADQGDEIGLLAMFDAPLPTIFEHTDFNDEARFLCDYIDLCNRILGGHMNVTYEQLRHVSPEKAFEIVLSEARKDNMVPADASVAWLRQFVEVGRSNARLIQRFTPTAFDCPLHLYLPRESGVLAEMSGKALPADLGWQSQLGQRLKLHHVPGNHFSMMSGENAGRLAELLRQCMQPSRYDAARELSPTV